MHGFVPADVRQHPVEVTEFGWPDPTNGAETQNVVSYLHGSQGLGRGFIGWELNKRPAGQLSGTRTLLRLFTKF
jgi:hypothetical protein